MKMKFLQISFLSLILFSCGNDYDDNLVYDATSSEAFYSLFESGLQNQTQNFQFNAEDGMTTFTSINGVNLTINGNCLLKNGQPVTGQVDIEFVEIFKRSEMFLTNKLTMGLNGNQKQLLNSGGEFYINATQNGEQLTLNCEMHLETPTLLTGGTIPQIDFFTGNIDSNGNVIWELAPMLEGWVASLSTDSSQDAYNALLLNFGWFNYDKFQDTGNGTTTITANVPQGYGNGNSLVLIATKNLPNSLGSIGGEYPIGLECHLIFVSEKNGSFLYSILENQTIVNNHTIAFPLSGMQTAMNTELATIIDNLQ